MANPSSTSGPEPGDADRSAGGQRFVEEDYRPPPRPRTSPLKILAMVILSFLAAGLLFRAAVEAVRHFIGD
jgi:hypothetical protein